MLSVTNISKFISHLDSKINGLGPLSSRLQKKTEKEKRDNNLNLCVSYVYFHLADVPRFKRASVLSYGATVSATAPPASTRRRPTARTVSV